MRGDCDLWMPPERTAFRQRFFANNVQHSIARFTGIERREQRVFINQLSATNVNKQRAVFHGQEERVVSYILGFWRMRHRQHNDVGFAQRVVQLAQWPDNISVFRWSCRALKTRDMTTHRLNARADRDTNRAIADNQPFRARNFALIERFPLATLAVARGTPFIDIRPVTDVIAFATLPRVARDGSGDPDPCGPGRSVSLTTYIDMVEKLGARILNDPRPRRSI